MRILIDIVHPADVNFYKNAIDILREQNHEIILSVMNRGNLPNIVAKELGKSTIIGNHSKGKLIKKAYFNTKRILGLLKFINKIAPDTVTSFSYYPAAAVFGKKINSVIFHDDFEYKLQFELCKVFAKKFIVPNFIPINGKNIKKYRFYKEWAYLNPKYFKPYKGALNKYGLEENKYVFIRDIAPISLNYSNKNNIEYSKIITLLHQKGLKVVVSIEDKSRKNEFKGCIILEEPITNIHSIVFHSLALISSGDTMIREAALLGVPAYYIGTRNMSINTELINQNFISVISEQTLLTKELKKLSKKSKVILLKKVKKYTKNLDDITQIIINEVLTS